MFVDSRLYLNTLRRWLLELKLTNSDQVIDVSKHRIVALMGLYLMGFYNVSWVLAMSLISSNTAGATKKSLGSVSMAIFYVTVNHFLSSSCRGAQATLANSFANGKSGGKHHWSPILPRQSEALLYSRDRCYDLLLLDHGILWYTIPVSYHSKFPLWLNRLLTRPMLGQSVFIRTKPETSHCENQGLYYPLLMSKNPLLAKG